MNSVEGGNMYEDARNSKATAEGDAVASQNSAKAKLPTINIKKTSIVQSERELTVPIENYKHELLLLPCSRKSSALVDCFDYILDNVGGIL